MSHPTLREARLRPEHAERYPGIEPGVWFTAATLAEHLDRRLGREGGDGDAGPRVLSLEHFEFRGGERPIGMRADLGRRNRD
jgi:hypothetical protein